MIIPLLPDHEWKCFSLAVRTMPSVITGVMTLVVNAGGSGMHQGLASGHEAIEPTT
jgi:hypothetical protein